MKAVEPIPYSCQEIDDSDLAAVTDVLRSSFLTQGPKVPEFESVFAARHEVEHAVAVCNATAALHIACLAMGLGPGGLLWTTPNSFVASANCALYCGAEVDFVDIDPCTRNISVIDLARRLSMAEQSGTLPDIVVPVDFAGFPADLAAIRELADRYGFRILQDASHATGASAGGRPVGSQYADICVFSFHPVKIVTTGEGGMAVTQDAQLAERMRLLRSHGITRDPSKLEHPSPGPWYYEQQLLGLNYRLTDMQAALGISQMERLEGMRARREQLAARYDEILGDLPILLPPRRQGVTPAWHLYVVEVDESRTAVSRSAVFQALRDAQIGANLHYAPIHLQPFYRRRGFKLGDFPLAEAYANRAITIPLFPRMTTEQQDRVADVLRASLNGTQP